MLSLIKPSTPPKLNLVKNLLEASKKFPTSLGFQDLREEIRRRESILLVFGTGWGLEKSILKEADYVLDPVEGVGEYNHLPVRAAIAIILDRLIAR